MSRQDKATTERHTRTLRELVKRPENKVCADCKRNDPRWASWNLGVFLCIRCSGIHRGMGTHISKVKSVDLDVWTPEQMESIQKWGNHLANLYWEAHLKPGHMPPEHKMESFIRSKYETRRWALEGPLPADPSILHQAGSSSNSEPIFSPPQPTADMPVNTQHLTPPSARVTRQPQPHKLLSSNHAGQRTVTNQPERSSVQTSTARPNPIQAPENELFSLDFHNPSPSAQPIQAASAPQKDVKSDILSLFSTPPPAVAQTTNLWANANPAQSKNGYGADSDWNTSGWSDPMANGPNTQWSNASPEAKPTVPTNDLFGGSNIWKGSAPAMPATDASSSHLFSTAAQKKDDVFGDIWSGFK